MKWIWIAGGVVAVVLVAVMVIGWLLPVKHRASRQATFIAPPEAVWRLMTDVESFPSWRSDVKTVERLPDRDGRPAWVEEGSNGRIPLAVERSDAPACWCCRSRTRLSRLAARGRMRFVQRHTAAL
jgi:hypothetical protein